MFLCERSVVVWPNPANSGNMSPPRFRPFTVGLISVPEVGASFIPFRPFYGFHKAPALRTVKSGIVGGVNPQSIEEVIGGHSRCQHQ